MQAPAGSGAALGDLPRTNHDAFPPPCPTPNKQTQYPTCLRLLASGRIDVKPLITHRFGFNPDDVASGFEAASKPEQSGAIKVMFNL